MTKLTNSYYLQIQRRDNREFFFKTVEISTVLEKKISVLSLRCICLLWKGSVVFVAIFLLLVVIIEEYDEISETMFKILRCFSSFKYKNISIIAQRS